MNSEEIASDPQDEPLLREAMEQALAYDDVVEAVAELERITGQPTRPSLENAVYQARDEIYLAAAAELDAYRSAEALKEQALSDAVANQVAGEPAIARRFTEFNDRIQEFDAQLEAAPSNGASEEEMIAALESRQATIEQRNELEAGVRSAVLERPEQWTRLVVAIGDAESAKIRALRALAERGVLDVVRPWLGQHLDAVLNERYSDNLVAEYAPGLAELPNPAHEVATETAARLGLL
jgi:hypothetical protein